MYYIDMNASKIIVIIIILIMVCYLIYLQLSTPNVNLPIENNYESFTNNYESLTNNKSKSPIENNKKGLSVENNKTGLPIENNKIGLAVNSNQVIMNMIIYGIAQIPEIGGILSAIAKALWPSSSQTTWQQIQTEVQKVVHQSINQNDYTNLQNTVTNLSNEIGNYLSSISQNLSMTDITNNLINCNNTAIDNICYFGTIQSINQTPVSSCSSLATDQILLFLPLFAQFVNLHLSILRDGYKLGIVPLNGSNSLNAFINTYITYATNTYQNIALPYANKLYTTYGFNSYISFLNSMQQSVLNYVKLWPYFDVTVYPNGYQIPVSIFDSSSDIYYTISGQVPGIESRFEPALTNYLSTQSNNVTIQSLQVTGLDNTPIVNGILGTNVTFSNGTIAGYTGRTSQDQIQTGTTNITTYNILPTNTIAQIFISYDKDNVLIFVPILEDGTSLKFAPTNYFFTATAAAYYISSSNTNYTLSNIYSSADDIPPPYSYGYTPDMLMSFRISKLPKTTQDLSTDEIRNVYTSSVHPITLDHPTFNKYKQIGIAQKWDAERYKYLLGLKISKIMK